MSALLPYAGPPDVGGPKPLFVATYVLHSASPKQLFAPASSISPLCASGFRALPTIEAAMIAATLYRNRYTAYQAI